MEVREKNKGLQVSFNFKNGYGVSAIRFPGSYGHKSQLWELAVLDKGNITYNTPITDDVIGYCDDDDIAEIIHKVKNLKKP